MSQKCVSKISKLFVVGFPLRMMYYSVVTQAYMEKEIQSSPNRSRIYDLPRGKYNHCIVHPLYQAESKFTTIMKGLMPVFVHFWLHLVVLAQVHRSFCMWPWIPFIYNIFSQNLHFSKDVLDPWWPCDGLGCYQWNVTILGPMLFTAWIKLSTLWTILEMETRGKCSLMNH